MKKRKRWISLLLFTSILVTIPVFSETICADNKPHNKRTFGKNFKRNHREAVEWGDHHYSKWLKNLSENEKTGLKAYLGHHVDAINTHLRENQGSLEGAPESLKNKIAGIDSALKKAKVPEDITVYRRVTDMQFNKEVGTLRPENRDSGKLVDRDALIELRKEFYGKTFVNHSYMSTSLSQDPPGAPRHPVLLKISVPAGTNAGLIDKLSPVSQAELLVQRGYKFRYTSFDVGKDNSGREYVVIETELRWK